MKFITFRGHIYKRLTNEFGFKKTVKKKYCVENGEMIMFVNIDKSSFSNAAIIQVNVVPFDLLRYLDTDKPDEMNFPQVDLTHFLNLNNYIELDELEDFGDVDKKIDSFFEKVFPKIQTCDDIKKFCIENKIKIFNIHLKKLWNINI